MSTKRARIFFHEPPTQGSNIADVEFEDSTGLRWLSVDEARQPLLDLLRETLKHDPFENNERTKDGRTYTFCMDCDAGSYDGWSMIAHEIECLYARILAELDREGYDLIRKRREEKGRHDGPPKSA